MPTLLIVQVGLGRAVTDTTNMTSTISEFDVEARATSSIALDTLILSTQNGYPTGSVSEEGNHPFGGEIRGPLTNQNVFTSHKETNRSLSLENPTTQ